MEIRVLNQAVKRNLHRFPDDLMFQPTSSELTDLRSQNVTLADLNIRKHMVKNPPYVFTEAGSFALSFVLRSVKAVEMGLFIIRAFTHLRRFVLKNENLMMELKNNDHLSTTFSNFEKRIEQDLIVLYKNTSKFEKRFKSLEEDVKILKKNFKF